MCFSFQDRVVLDETTRCFFPFDAGGLKDSGNALDRGAPALYARTRARDGRPMMATGERLGFFQDHYAKPGLGRGALSGPDPPVRLGDGLLMLKLVLKPPSDDAVPSV